MPASVDGVSTVRTKSLVSCSCQKHSITAAIGAARKTGSRPKFKICLFGGMMSSIRSQARILRKTRNQFVETRLIGAGDG
jgi:hypothetical protein